MRTKAGRALLEREAYNSRSFSLITADAIAAIESEAGCDRLREAASALNWFMEHELRTEWFKGRVSIADDQMHRLDALHDALTKALK